MNRYKWEIELYRKNTNRMIRVLLIFAILMLSSMLYIVLYGVQ